MKRAILMLLTLVLLAVPSLAEEQTLKLPLDVSPGMPLNQANYLDKWHYKDPTIEMAAREVKVEGDAVKTQYWIAEVKIEDATQLRTMPANAFTYASHTEARRIARRSNAVLACSGDFWWRDVKWKGNYVLRQGDMYMYELNGRSDVLLIDEDGDFHVIRKATEETVPLPDETTGKVMYEGKQIYNGLCFGPALVIDGKAQVIEPDDKIISEKDPARIALCQIGPLRYAVVCMPHRIGNLQYFANLLESIGVITAYNLDGGDSTMMFTGGNMINRNGSVREIGDMIYFASAWPGEDGAN